VTKAKEVIRKHVKFLDEDRPLYPDHTTMKELVKSGEILHEVETAVGSLEINQQVIFQLPFFFIF